LLGKAYADQQKTVGVDIEDIADKDKIWARYVEAFKSGAYNYIKEELDPATSQPVSRKYFSGGARLSVRNKLIRSRDSAALPKRIDQDLMLTVDLDIAKGGRAVTQAYRPQKSGGLLDLERVYNQNRKMMLFVSAITGAFLGGFVGMFFTQEPGALLSASALGAGLMARPFSQIVPLSEYRLIEAGLDILEHAKSTDHIKAARKLFIDGMAASSSELVRRVGLTGLEECDHLLSQKRDERYTLVFPPFARPINARLIAAIESNLLALGLGGMISIVVHHEFPYFAVAPIMPTDTQRDLIRTLIRNDAQFDQILAGVSLKDEEKTLFKGVLWYGLYDLLYRQDGSDNFTPEHQSLYANNEIFLDPNVLKPLAEDLSRPQEDYLVDLLLKKMDPDKKYKILVFATGSGVLVNNILQKLPNISQVVEYDASKNSNTVANEKRRKTLPASLYGKVKQITADVLDFDKKLQGEEFDFVISTASLRFMNKTARQGVVDSLKSRSLLKNGGVFIYMDTHAHGDMIQELSKELQSAGMAANVISDSFPGHRDTMFYVFVHEYQINDVFRRQVDQMMVLKKAVDLPAFLYWMAGLRPIGFDVLSAEQTSISRRAEQFKVLVDEFSNQIEGSFKKIFYDTRVFVKHGPSSKVTINLLGKNPEVHELDSYDLSVESGRGQVGRVTVYDGRSIGVNTLVLGRMALQDPSMPRVIVTQHILTSKYGYEKALEDLRVILDADLPQNIVRWEEDLDAFVEAVVGLTEVQVREMIRSAVARGVFSKQEILNTFKAAPRTVYPSQEYGSFNGAGVIFRDAEIHMSQLAKTMDYDSLSGVVSLPDGLQNLVLYRKCGFEPVVPDVNQLSFNGVQTLLPGRERQSLKAMAWSLSRRMREQQLILVQKNLNAQGEIRQDASMSGVRDFLETNFDIGWTRWAERITQQMNMANFLVELLRGKALALSLTALVHYLKIRRIVNPDNRSRTVLYAGAGGDIIAPALAVGPGRVIMASRERLNVEKFREFFDKNWESAGKRVPMLFTRFFGYSPWRTMNTEEKFFYVLLNNLRALEIDRQDIHMGVDEGVPYISIWKTWPGTNDFLETRFYFLIENDLTDPNVFSKELSVFLRDGFDVFLQKAGHTMPAKYARWLPVIGQAVHKGGYFVMDTSRFSPVRQQPRYEPLPVLEKEFQVRTILSEDVNNGYGSFDVIIQKIGDNAHALGDQMRGDRTIAANVFKLSKNGGIDLTHDKIDLQVQRSVPGFRLNIDPAMIQRLQDAAGLTPVIVDMQPMTITLPMFLGLKNASSP
ncbi:MAG: methyltransferase domain-containing protein, partial [Candidatus Omnitrophota bacterium]